MHNFLHSWFNAMFLCRCRCSVCVCISHVYVPVQIRKRTYTKDVFKTFQRYILFAITVLHCIRINPSWEFFSIQECFESVLRLREEACNSSLWQIFICKMRVSTSCFLVAQVYGRKKVFNKNYTLKQKIKSKNLKLNSLQSIYNEIWWFKIPFLFYRTEWLFNTTAIYRFLLKINCHRIY